MVIRLNILLYVMKGLDDGDFDYFKIAALGIVITVLGQVLKHSGREEMTFLLSLAGLVIVLFWIVPYISELFKAMQDMFSL